MYYYSTRDKNREHRLTASEAILKGLAPDGGLYVPSQFPQLDCSLSPDLPYGQFASKVLAPFFKDDELEDSLEAICTKAFDFPLVLNSLKDKTVLELFHGPTCAFKDFGARFLAFSMEELLRKNGKKLCILVATSGDTGGAVASAFHRRDNLSVKVLFPKGRVAQRQKKQLTCWGDNVESFEVDGSFDDCQKMVKSAFVDKRYMDGLSSANSINLGRLLPQMVYYVYASMLYQKEKGKKIGAYVTLRNETLCNIIEFADPENSLVFLPHRSSSPRECLRKFKTATHPGVLKFSDLRFYEGYRNAYDREGL